MHFINGLCVELVFEPRVFCVQVFSRCVFSPLAFSLRALSRFSFARVAQVCSRVGLVWQGQQALPC